MKKSLIRSFSIITSLLLLFTSFGFTYQADRDLTFDTGILKNFGDSVFTTAIQPDGKIIVGGDFTTYNGSIQNRLIRLNSDGSRDSSFDIGNGFDNNIYTIAIQLDGKIIVGGNFTTYNGSIQNHLIRLNNDGSKDSSFDIGDGFNAYIHSIAVQSDGKIVVGGIFTNYNGSTQNRLIRLNSDGSKDSSFDIGDGFDGNVDKIVIQSDGKIIVGGGFMNYQGISNNGIIRLDTEGNKDISFDTGIGFDFLGEGRSEIFTMAIQSDGKIVMGGYFSTYQGVSANEIIRLNSDGSRDSSFDIGSGFDSESRDYPYTIAIQSDGKIIVGGWFSVYNGTSTNHIVRLNSDGSRDSSFDMGNGFDSSTNTITIQSDGKIIVGGEFYEYNGNYINNLIRLNIDGSKDTSFNTTSFDGSINTIAIQSDGKILVGGFFMNYQGISTNAGIVRLNSDGSRDSSFNTDLLNGYPYTIAIQSDGKIIVGGWFSVYSGISSNYIIRLNNDGSMDSSFDIGSGFNGNIVKIIIQPDDKILVGGDFTTYNGITQNYIVRLNSDGGRDSSFDITNELQRGTGGYAAPGGVHAIDIQSDGKIMAGGGIISYSGSAITYLIRLNNDGSMDSSFDMGTGFIASYHSVPINEIAIQSDEKIIVGGYFGSYQGIPADRIIRLNSDGSRDSSFDNSLLDVDYPSKITIQSDGKILLGGNFYYDGNNFQGLIRLNNDGYLDTGFNLENGFNGSSINDIAINNYGKIYIGGYFTSYKGEDAPYLIALYGDSVVNIPNSNDANIIEAEFTDKGYATGNSYLEGTAPISLHQTNGLILDEIKIKNDNILVSFPENTQFKQANGTTNYSGIFIPPKHVTIDQINNKPVISAIRLGNFNQSLTLDGTANIKIPAPTKNIGDIVKVYSSQNGSNRSEEGTAVVVEYNGQKYADLSVNHFTYFAIAENVEGSFTINNDATSTTSQEVTLNIDAPGATLMRFSNTSGTNRSGWVAYSTTYPWTLSEGYGSKTVYAQFDIDSEIFDVSDSILYADGNGTQGNITLTITGGVTECVYGTSLDMNAQDVKIGIPYTFSGTFPSAWYCQDYQGIDGGWTLTIQTTDLSNEKGNVISGSNLLISHDPVVVEGDLACTGNNGTATQFYSAPYVIFAKASESKKICKVSANNVGLLVNVPANQAPGSYSGTLTLTMNGF